MIREKDVPDHWNVKKISNISQRMKTGSTPKRSEDDYWEGNIKWSKADEISSAGKFMEETEEKITEKALNNSSVTVFDEEHAFVTIIGANLGSAVLPRSKMGINQQNVAIKLDSNVDREFFYYYIKSIKDYLQELGRGGGQEAINQTVLGKVKMPIPPLNEQEELVEIIESNFVKLNNLEKSISEVKELSSEYEDSLLAFILSGKKDMAEGAVGGIPTEDVVPDDWRLEDFGDVVDVNPRISKPDTDTFAHVPMDGVSAETQSIDYFSERDSVYSGLAKFEEGDILFARITPCMENGKVAIVEELPEGRDMSFGSTEFAVFRTKEDVSTEYVFNYVKSQFIREVAEDQMKGATGRERVPLDFFKKDLKIPIPPKGQEDEVLEKLRNIRENVNKANHSIKMVDELFDEYRDSVLAHAFKGELVDIEAEDRDSEDSNENESEGSRPEFDGDGQQSLEQIAGGSE